MSTCTVAEARELLAKLPRKQLGFYPTPLHKLERLSEETGVNVYLKRDDLSGVSTFGGNKIRKLEYLLGDACAQGADTVFTYGATQSNHAMQTVAAANGSVTFDNIYPSQMANAVIVIGSSTQG